MKILKLFVCLLLILSTSLVNSLAAISVSDGSAFVTKAEFAADLNNLSNRMSSLENSLDAKIDSLVSSYLSRNGIWNGEKQTVSSTTTWDIKPKSISLSNNNGSLSESIQNATIVEKTSKAGFLTGFLYFKGKEATDIRWGYRFNVNANTNWYADSGFYLSASVYEILEGTNDKISRYSTTLGNAIGAARSRGEQTGTICTFALPSSELLFPISFFVSKDSKLELDVYENANFSQVNDLNAMGYTILLGIKDNFNIY